MKAGHRRAGTTARHSRRTSRFIVRVLSYFVLLVVLVTSSAALVVPKAAGAIPLTVLSDSMAPTMPVGSLAVVRPTMETLTGTAATLDPEQIDELNHIEDIKVGDVIVFAPRAGNDMLVIHRVIGMSMNSSGQRVFTTQGDNNSAVDEPVSGYQVRAVLWYHLPLLGFVNNSLSNDSRQWVAIGAATLGYGWALSQFVIALRRGRKGASEADSPRESAEEPPLGQRGAFPSDSRLTV